MQKNFKILDTVYQSPRTTVYRAKQISDGLPVILKVRGDRPATEPDAGLAYEYAIGTTLTGDHTIDHLALKQLGGQTVLVLHDDAMTSLKSTIPADGFDLQQFLHLAVEITSALEEIHGQDIIHKDINPANIIVDPSLGAVKLIDFGLATRISEEIVGFEPPAVLQGTLTYIAPEQTGRINMPVDLRADLYSLGITFYHLLTGQPPFTAAGPGELLHAHIATLPRPVRDIRQDIPQAISLIVDKLLKKSPHERYQTAGGVKADMLDLQQAISNGQKITDFQPGNREHAGKILLPGKLYGREKETAQLFHCLDQCVDVGQVVIVSGPAGIGKTALIHELYSPVTARQGFFVSGKFEQLHKGAAYTALAEAANDFVKQCLGQDEITAATWRQVVQAAAGDFGQVITDIAPAFEDLLGRQEQLAPIPPLEAAARLESVFVDVMRAICAVGRPIVIFLDDLQWADPATLALAEKLIDAPPKNLLLVLSHRDSTLPPGHPVSQFFDRIAKTQIASTNIQVDSISQEAIDRWINDMLPEAGLAAQELATLVAAKTGGNPFYIKSLLHLMLEKQFLQRGIDGSLRIDMDAIVDMSVAGNVVDHLIKKISDLDDREQKFLTEVSILGNSFSLDTLAVLKGEENDGYQDIIQKLVYAQLLIKRGNTIMFAHDRVQEAAASLLSNDHSQRLHLTAGRKIQAVLDTRGQAEEQLDAYLHHFNAAAGLITDPAERREIARLNIISGKRLKRNAAYQAAEQAFAQAIALLPENPFATDYNTTIDLFTEYGETLFLNLQYEKGEKYFDLVIAHSKSPFDNAQIYITQIHHYAASQNLKKSMATALHALDMLGVRLPRRFLKIAALTGYLKARRILKNKTPDDLLNLPITQDPMAQAQMEVLTATGLSAYMAYPAYYPITTFRHVQILMTSGNYDRSPILYIGYAVILAALGKADTAYTFGETAIALMNKLGTYEHETTANYVFAAHIHHWKKPLREGLPLFDTAIATGLKTGSYEYAAYAAALITIYSFYAGDNIDGLIRQYSEQEKTLKGFGKEHPIIMARYWHHHLLAINDPDGDGQTLSTDTFDENRLIQTMKEQHNLSTLGFCFLVKMQLAYLAGDYNAAEAYRQQARGPSKALRSLLFEAIYHFFAALTCIAVYREHKKNPLLLWTARRSLKKLKKWGADCPENYLYKAQLVEAELLSIKDNQGKAIKLYEAAVANAGNADNSLDLGIACECMGRYLEKIGLNSMAKLYIHRSISVFQDWGALNKSSRLSKIYGITIAGDKDGTTSKTDSSSRITSTDIDLDFLSTTIQALTSDLNFTSLMETLLTAVMQRSGATRVVYLHKNQETLTARAEKQAGRDARILENRETHLSAFHLPTALLEKCLSQNGLPVLENIEPTMRRPDETTNGTSPMYHKSVLIIPLQKQKTVTGLVYLENSLIENAFRKEHVHLLSLLAGQAAIAIENALIFDRLNEERDYSDNLIGRSPSLIYGIDGNGVTTFINPTIAKITGYREDEIIGQNWWELFYPGENYQQVDQLFRDFETGEVVDYEMQLTCKNGEKRDVAWNSLTIREDNKIVKLIGFGNDITDRKKAEAQFRTMAFLVDSAASPIAMSTLQSDLTHVNPAFLRCWRYDRPEEVLGRPIKDFFLLNESMDKKIAQMMQTTTLLEEAQAIRKDGTTFDVQVSAAVVNDADGRAIGLMASALDITERKRAEKELQHLRNYLTNIIDSMPSILIGVDLDCIITQWNHKAETATDLSAKAAVGQPLATTFPRLANDIEEISRAIQTHEVLSHTRRTRLEDGQTRYEDVTIYPLMPNGVEGAVIRIDDTTEKTRLEEQLNQSRKMDAIGHLAGGVAHDFNNTLSGIIGATQLLQYLDSGMEQERQEYIDIILQSATRAADLTTKLLAFARKGKIISSTVNINGIVDDTMAILRRTIDRRITIKVDKNAPNALVVGDSAGLQNALINIGINASQAMPDGGILHIEISNIQLDSPFCTDSPFDIHPGEYVKIAIQDTGCGIPTENIDNIFEPFFTTKDPGKGTGLGLAAVYGTIQDHHGAITVISEIDKGTTFHLFLPCSEENVHLKHVEEKILTGSGQILLVDDEAMIRNTAKMLIKQLGYKVMLAENGREAVDLFQQHHAEINLVLMDITMPEMNGPEAFFKMKAIDKDCKIIISSGFAENDGLDDMRQAGLAGFLRKPYRLAELSRILDDVLKNGG